MMKKDTFSLFAFLDSKQKRGSVSYSGQRFPKRHVSLLNRLSLSIYFLLGAGLAASVALISPLYLYPGTMASDTAREAIKIIYNQGIVPVEKSVGQMYVLIKSQSIESFSHAPLSLNALISIPKVTLPKIQLSAPVLAAANERPSVAISTSLIAETIKDSLDPLINTPNNALFPADISLGDQIQATQTQADVVVKDEPKPEPKALKIVEAVKEPPKKVEPVQIQVAVQPVVMSGNYRWPVRGILSQGFSYYHPGVDIATKYGTAVFPVENGTVTAVINEAVGLGKHIVITHPDGLSSVYAHLSGMNVSVGQSVTQDTVIGAVGLTGRTTGAHLHLETRRDGRAFNPLGSLLK